MHLSPAHYESGRLATPEKAARYNEASEPSRIPPSVRYSAVMLTEPMCTSAGGGVALAAACTEGAPSSRCPPTTRVTRNEVSDQTPCLRCSCTRLVIT